MIFLRLTTWVISVWKTNQSLDYASTNEHQITVEVSDGELSDTAFITIDVTNIYPIITDQTFPVDEHSSDGTVIGQIAAMDYGNRTLSYAIASGNGDSLFALSTSGELTVNGDLDYEDQTSYEIVVSVEDSEGLRSQATITVEVNDVDDPLIITDQTFPVDEHSSDGTVIGQIAATAYGSKTIASYAILSVMAIRFSLFRRVEN